MKRAITSGITLNLIAGIVITIVTVVAAILWMSARQNDQAARSTETMVVGGVKAIERSVESLASDYAWWDDAYSAYVGGDADWFDVNFGDSVEEAEVADLFAVISTDGVIEYSWTLSEELSVDDFLPAAAVESIASVAAELPDSLSARSASISVDRQPVIIAVSRITPFLSDPEIDPTTLPLLVVGLKLSSERLEELGKSFLIDDLRIDQSLDDVLAAGSDSTPIVDMAGTTIGYFVWTPPTPGFAVLRSIFLPVAIALVLFCVIAFATAYRARRVAIALAESEKEALIAARTDSMTDLMNRTGFIELLESPEFRRASDAGELAIIYMDINGFKTVNDSIGHQGGDELVQVLAKRIASALPQQTHFARIGGDEFAVAIVGGSVRETATRAAAEIVECLDQPFTVHGFEFHVTVAVGYAVAVGSGLAPSDIVRRADIAMYQAKNGAEREALLYNATMETGALEKKQIETALRRALEQNELEVIYQPVALAGDLSIVGVEALVRWTSKELGPVSPSVFVTVAEETGLIHDLGRFVVNRTCADAHKWPQLRIALNLSPVQLREPNFETELLAIITQHDIKPQRLELELTEGILVNNPTIARRKLARLKEMGFKLALDDFGTGFSSIGYLRQFPFDTLKVDRSFVRDVGVNATANALVQSLVSLGDAMDLSVIAEGIENEDQLKLLRLVQCEFVQGYLISRPLPADQLSALLASLGPERRLSETNEIEQGNQAEQA